MAKSMVSPGVFTNEKDQGYLQQGVAEIGGALIGRSPKGPAFEPTTISNFSKFRQTFGEENSDFIGTYTAREYLKYSDNLKFVRVLGGGAFSYETAGEIESGSKLLAVIRPTSDASGETMDIQVSGSTPHVSMSNFDLLVSESSGETVYSGVSLRSSDSNFIGNVLGTNPKSTATKFYVDHVYDSTVSSSLANYDGMLETGSVASETSTTITSDGYITADSPTVISQTFAGSTNHELFEVKPLEDGDAGNRNIKIGIFDIKPASDIVNSDYGQFSLAVRDYNDDDGNQEVLETFTGLNLNPDSTNYVARRIGDQTKSTNSDGEVTYSGDYENISEYIRVDMKSLEGVPESAVPFGFKNMKKYNSNTPDPEYKVSQSFDNEYDADAYFGEDFESTDIDDYHTALPDNAANVSNDFLLSNCADYNNTQYSGSISLTDSDLTARKFAFGFQRGFDGYDPRLSVDDQSSFSTISDSGSIEYRKAINTVKNPEEHSFNMMVIPEVNHREGSPVTSYAMEVCRDRGDALAIVDPGAKTDSINTVINTMQTVDNSYAASYWPWVKIKDEANNKNVYVPPSVVMPSVLAYTDSVAHEWYAPAGLNRGGLTSVLSVYKKLYRADRDKLYDARINPIASFPNKGPAVWGQKTLLASASNKKLDRVNIRRLLIHAKVLIASVTQYLVFEQNNVETWNRFKSIVNPILRDIQKENGLYDFRVQMAEGETMTANDIDRNIMKGAIFLKPVESAEYIQIDFNLMSTGATFPGE